MIIIDKIYNKNTYGDAHYIYINIRKHITVGCFWLISVKAIGIKYRLIDSKHMYNFFWTKRGLLLLYDFPQTCDRTT